MAALFVGAVSMMQYGCNWGSSSPVSPSAITSVFPPQGSDGALVTTLVTATFRDEMNATTINDTTFTLSLGGAPVTVSSVSYDSTSGTATLIPASDLISGSEYRATISSTVENTSGDMPLASNYVWSFTISPDMFLVTENESGITGNNRSDTSDIDGTGRYVVFESTATNLDPDITTTGLNQIYRKDTVTGEVELVSSDSSSLQVANNASFAPAISDNGRFVVFQSAATNLATITTGGILQVYIKDMADGSIELASRDINATAGNAPATSAVVSNDGRYVAFQSSATNLSSLNSNGVIQIYRKDMADESVDMISRETTLTGGANGLSASVDISSDGRFVVFESNATNLVSPPTSNISRIYFVDMNSPDTIELVSVADDGSDAQESSHSPSVSDDGRYVVFESNAANLDLSTTDNNNATDVFLRDRNPSGAPSTTLVSVNPVTATSADSASTNASISSNGSYIAFQSIASDIVSGDNLALIDIYVRNLDSATIMIDQVNISATGINPTVNSGRATISKDGRYVSFDSVHKYTLDDTDGLFDVYRAYNSSYQ
ncbi:MAG: Ig-like domain-containing protein [Gammaproteobacteria bacterium]